MVTCPVFRPWLENCQLGFFSPCDQWTSPLSGSNTKNVWYSNGRGLFVFCMVQFLGDFDKSAAILFETIRNWKKMSAIVSKNIHILNCFVFAWLGL